MTKKMHACQVLFLKIKKNLPTDALLKLVARAAEVFSGFCKFKLGCHFESPRNQSLPAFSFPTITVCCLSLIANS